MDSGLGVDRQGNVYVIGWTEGSFPVITRQGSTASFVRKYDSLGNELWTREFGNSGWDQAQGVGVDRNSGNAYVVGFTEGAYYGQSNAGGRDAYVRNYDGGGDPLWTRQFGSRSEESALSAGIDRGGNVYVVGWTAGTLHRQSSLGSSEAYVRKYDRNGTEIWIRQFGAAGWGEARDVVTDWEGNVYVAGWTEGGLPGHASFGRIDSYLRKYDGNGVELWTHQFGTAEQDRALGLGVDNAGNVYVVGDTGGAFPGQTFSGGRNDAFVIKMSP